jgi:outer membrane protein OmpA-like peptidoglycan-associated protein
MKKLNYPFSPEAVRELKVGDMVLITGKLFTGRDAVHKYLHDGNKPPVNLKNQIIYHCGPVTLKDKAGKWSAPDPIKGGVNTEYHDAFGAVSADGQTMYFTRTNQFKGKVKTNVDKVVNLKILKATLLEGEWTNIEEFAYNSDDFSNGHPALSADGKTMYFSSDRPGGYGQTDIYETHQENGAWTKPTNLGEAINSPGKEMFPTVFNDGTLFYSSDGNAGMGGLDLYMSTPQNNRFTEVQNLGYPLNSNADDFGLLLSKDLKSGFISSNRKGGKGFDDIYSFKSVKEIISLFTINGIVRNKLSKEPISNSRVDLYDENRNKLKSLQTNNNGYFEFPLSANKSYVIEAEKDEYLKDAIKVNTDDRKKKQLNYDLGLHPLGSYGIVGTILHGVTKEPINNVSVLIKNTKTGEEVLKTLTTQTGDFNKILGKLTPGTTLDYGIQFQKDGFATKTLSFNQVVAEPTIFKMNKLIDMTLMPNDQVSKTPSDEDDTFALNPIYFGFDKSDINGSAQQELNNIAENLKSRKNVVIEIVAHCDCRGSMEYNQMLSKKRAIATANYLKSRGVNENQFVIKCVGENQLVTDCPCDRTNTDSCSEEEHQKNRRASFKVIKFK